MYINFQNDLHGFGAVRSLRLDSTSSKESIAVPTASLSLLFPETQYISPWGQFCPIPGGNIEPGLPDSAGQGKDDARYTLYLIYYNFWMTCKSYYVNLFLSIAQFDISNRIFMKIKSSEMEHMSNILSWNSVWGGGNVTRTVKLQ